MSDICIKNGDIFINDVAIPLIVHGVIFPNIETLCRKYDLTKGGLIGRLKKGYSLQDSVDSIVEFKKSRNNKYTILGKVFKNKRQIYDYFKISPSSLNYYLNKNYSVEDSVLSILNSRCSVIPVNGKEFKTLLNACEYYKVSYVGVCNDVRVNNLTAEQAINKRLDIKNIGKSIFVKGLALKNKSEACKYYKVNLSTVLNNEKRLGLSFEDAIFYKKEVFTAFSKEFSSKKEACVFYKVSYFNVCKLLRNKEYSLEEAILIEQKKGKSLFNWNGKEYKNLSDICNDFGLSYSSFLKRKKAGWSIEEIVGVIPRIVKGVIASRHIGLGVYINGYLENSYYRCNDNGKIKYYSKDELFEIRRKAFENGERF